MSQSAGGWIALPDEVLAELQCSSGGGVLRWTLNAASQMALLGALSRGLASTDLDGFTGSSRLAFALGDELAYPATGTEAEAMLGANTAIVQHLERTDPLFQQIVSELSACTKRRVSISAYIADVHSRAFSWHVDRWDGVILQLQGTKRFELADHSSNVLAPGHALFLPQDIEHRTHTIAQSVHLSIAFFRDSAHVV